MECQLAAGRLTGNRAAVFASTQPQWPDVLAMEASHRIEKAQKAARSGVARNRWRRGCFSFMLLIHASHHASPLLHIPRANRSSCHSKLVVRPEKLALYYTHDSTFILHCMQAARCTLHSKVSILSHRPSSFLCKGQCVLQELRISQI